MAENGTKGGGMKTLLLNLGVNLAVIGAVTTWVLNTTSEHQADIKDMKSEIDILKVKLETDRAQWNVIREIHAEVSTMRSTSTANERLLDRILTAALREGGPIEVNAPVDPGPELNAPPREFEDFKRYHEDRFQEEQRQKGMK